jgi:hypothetical protein
MPNALEFSHVGGAPPTKHAPNKGHTYSIGAVEEFLQIHWLTHDLLSPKWVVVQRLAWPTVHSLDVSSTQSSRANVGAIALFGVLGLAARRPPGSYVTVSSDVGQTFFYTESPPAVVRAAIERVMPVEVRGLLRVEGQPINAASAPSAADSAVARVARLQELLDAGVVSPEEFQAQRQRILDQL